MKFYLPLAILALFLSAESFAQSSADKGGNGGNAIVCFSNPEIVRSILKKPVAQRVITNENLKAITSIEALDLFEARSKGGQLDDVGQTNTLIQLAPNESNTAFLERVARRTEQALPLVSRAIRASVKKFSGKIFQTSSDGPVVGITQVYDVGNLSYQLDSSRCVLSTVMNQSGQNETLQLTIDSRLLNHPKHSQLSRKALMLHEMVYLWGRENGQTKSDMVRKVVGLLLREHFSRNEMAALLLYRFDRSEYAATAYFEDQFSEAMIAEVKIAIDKARMILGTDVSAYRSETADRVNKLHEEIFGRGMAPDRVNCDNLVKAYPDEASVPRKDHGRERYRYCVNYLKKLADYRSQTDAIYAFQNVELARFKVESSKVYEELMVNLNQKVVSKMSTMIGQSCYSDSTVLRQEIGAAYERITEYGDSWFDLALRNFKAPHCDDSQI